MNKTKIIATIGPSSCSKDMLKGLILAGMDVARINLTHASYKFCEEVVKNINVLNEELDAFTAVMFDTRGPELEVGHLLGGKAELQKDTKIRIYIGKEVGDNTKFYVNYINLIEEVNIDTTIKLNEGRVILNVIDKGDDYLICKVVNGGTICEKHAINIIGSHLKKPYLSEQDRKDIEFANKLKVDFLALSFIECHEDILDINDILIELENDHMSIVAKIENELAYNDIDEILKIADGIMIARGDLGTELPLERVPGIQKDLVRRAHKAGKISIVATEMLASMEEKAIPTRAEVSDVANAVLDGADAIMLSGETTIGKYPIQTVETMRRIATTAEIDINYEELMTTTREYQPNDITGTIAKSVSEITSDIDAKLIITPTASGYTAKRISRFRPSCPIIAVTPDLETVKSLKLHFGVHPVLIDELNTLDRIIAKSKKIAVKMANLEEGDKVVITGGYPFKSVKHTNFLEIEEI